MDNKQRYKNHCEAENSVPIFSRGWWLDIVCETPNDWQVALVEKDGKIIASMPYYCKKKFCFNIISMPLLTHTLGPWLAFPGKIKYSKSLAQQKDLMQSLIRQLPDFDYFMQNWNYQYSNWLPFYWNNFTQQTFYTYVLTQLDNEELLWAGLQDNIKTDIRKAENRYKLQVRDDLSIEDFLSLSKLTFSRQGITMPYSEDLVRRLDKECEKRNCRKIWIAEDQDGLQHAGIYIVWDENSAYYVMGGGDPKLRNSGATSLCLWKAILHAATITKRFDFEGSMLEPVERFFRGFGATQMPYFSVTKIPSRILRIRDCLLKIIK